MPEKPTFEDKLSRLSELVDELEKGDLPLSQGVALYKEGVSLAVECGREIAGAKHEIKLATESGTIDFDLEAEEEDDS